VEKSDRGPHVSVRLGPVSRTQTFLLDNTADPPRPGDAIVIRTEQGTTLATVVPTIGAVAARRALPAQNVFVRHATDDDRATRLRQQRREEEARRSALVLIRQLKLEMKLSRVEQVFDGGRLIFYFTADGRIDFRELVRLLAAEFRTRIEMRQIGVRDEANDRRLRILRTPALLHLLAAGVRARLDPDGEAAGSRAQPVQALGAVRPPEVLSAVRAAERQGRASRRLWRRGHLQQPERLRHRRLR
jgi:hypothetical protein